MVKFKNTDIGQIPEDWDLVNWNDVFDFKSTASYSRAEIKPSGDVGYIHYGDIHTKIKATLDINKFVSGYISNKQLKTYTLIKKGDLVMADASEDLSGVGKSFEVIECPKSPVISGLHTFLIREKKNGFLANGFKGYFHFNPLIKKQYDSLATGLKVYSLSKSSFQHIQIPLPPLSEQKAITEVLLDSDTWIESLEKLIAKKRLIKQGVMQKLLTPKENWEVYKFNDLILEIIDNRGKTPPIKNTGFFLLEVNSLGGLFPNLKKVTKYIDKYNYDNFLRNYLNIGDLLFSTVGNIGITSIHNNNNSCIAQNIVGFRFKTNLSSVFMKYFFDTVYCQKKFKSILMSGVQPSIKITQLIELSFKLPSSNEQTRIASILSDLDAEIENLEIKLDKAKQLKQGMIQQLFTGKIRLTETKEKEIIPIKKHNDHFNDAVLIGALASCFASEQYPMTRFKYTKVSYLLKRYKEEQTTGYLKKAAGPYKPETRYGGAEKIAITNKYVATKKSVYKGKEYEGFVNSTNIQEAIDYFKKWYSEDALQWISRFKFETNDNLELWATVDMAIQDLKNEDKPINLEAVKEVIKNNKEWKDKLKRTIFSDDNIKNAIVRLETLYT